jgi:hypothetical protein
MRFFRPWHACHHAEFHRSMGHRHHGHPYGRHADGDDFARHLLDRVAARLDLDDEQHRRLGAWLAQLQGQRDALKGLAGGPDVAGLLDGERFASDAARQLLDAKLDALRAAGPGLITAFAEFFDALDAEQRQALRFMMRRAGRGRHAHGGTF